MFPTCPTVCNADLASDLMSSVSILDSTNVVDRTCNSVLFLADEPGLNDVTVPLSGAWLSTAAGNRTRIVTSLEEIAAHYLPGDEVYKAAKLFFANSGQRGVAGWFILGYWASATELAAVALDAINDCNPCWLHLTVAHYAVAGTVRHAAAAIPIQSQIAQWAVAHEKIAFLYSSDANHANPASAASLKGVLKAAGINDVYVHYSAGQCEQATDPVTGEPLYFAAAAPVTDANGVAVIDPATGIQAISDGTTPMSVIVHPYIEMLAAGWAANVDLTQSGSGYTLAYKPSAGAGFIGVIASAFNNATVSAVTGVLPDGTLNPNNNGYANVYVQTAGRQALYPGVSVGGSWIDQIHLNLFLKRRIKDELANLFFGSRRIPYDDARGRQQLATAVSRVMTDAQSAGHLTGDAVNWEQFGEYVRKGIGWVIRQDSFASQTAGRKNARLAPALKVCFIPAGATHHVPVTLCTLAVPSAINTL